MLSPALFFGQFLEYPGQDGRHCREFPIIRVPAEYADARRVGRLHAYGVRLVVPRARAVRG